MKNPMFTALQKTKISEQQFVQGALLAALASSVGVDINVFAPVIDTSGVDFILRIGWGDGWVETVSIAVTTDRATLDSKRINSIRRVAQRHGCKPFYLVIRNSVTGSFAVVSRVDILACQTKSIRPSVFVSAKAAIETIIEEVTGEAL